MIAPLYYIALCFVFVFAIKYIVHYVKVENVWKNLWPGDSIFVRYHGKDIGYKKILAKGDKEIKLQHYGLIKKDDFLAKLEDTYYNGQYILVL